MPAYKDFIETLLIFNAIYILVVPFFAHQTLWLCAFSLWTGTPLVLLLQDICVVEDDICLPHPPGYFDTFDLKGSSCDSLCDSEDCSRSSDTSSEDHDVSSELDITCALLPTPLPSGIDTADNSGLLTEGIALVTSVSDKILVPDVFQPSDSSRSLDITEQHLTVPSSLNQQLVAPSLLPDQLSQGADVDDIDLTEDLSNKPPSLTPSPVKPTVMHRLSEGAPMLFSRHNATHNNIIFPIRKPTTAKRSVAAIPDLTSVTKRFFSATRGWTKEEVQRRNLSGALRSALSGIRNSKVFNSVEQESKVPVHDPYDSWPYIRTAMEREFNESRELEGEESFLTGW